LIYCSLRPRIGDGWAIYNFLPERLPVNEQKVEIFILLLNSVFSAWNYCSTTNKKLIKCTSRPAIANANVGRIFIFVNRLKFLKSFLCPKQ
jgi:hypothetical protein